MAEGKEIAVVDATPKVYAAIAAVQADFSAMGLGKKDRNDFYKYDFRGIDALMVALSPLLVKHGLIIMPRGVERTGEERKTNDGKASFRVTLTISYSIICVEDGTAIKVGPFYGEAMDTSDKATNKAMSFAYKYMAFQTFCIPIKGQDEGDSDSPEVASKPDPASRELPQGGGDALMTEQQVKDCETAVRAMLKEIEALGGATEKEIADGVVKELVAGQGGYPALTKNEADHMYMALKDQFKRLKKAEERKESE